MLSADVSINSHCANCRKAGDGELAMCPCELVFYCGTNCQEAHWEKHKSECAHGRKTKIPVTKCANCLAVSNQNMWCPCGVILYCSRQCQREHWDSVHYKDCRTARSTAETAFSDSRQQSKFNDPSGKGGGAAAGGGGLGARFLAVVESVRNAGNVATGGIFRAKSNVAAAAAAGKDGGKKGGGGGGGGKPPSIKKPLDPSPKRRQ